jgi:hypothetical protein
MKQGVLDCRAGKEILARFDRVGKQLEGIKNSDPAGYEKGTETLRKQVAEYKKLIAEYGQCRDDITGALDAKKAAEKKAEKNPESQEKVVAYSDFTLDTNVGLVRFRLPHNDFKTLMVFGPGDGGKGHSYNMDKKQNGLPVGLAVVHGVKNSGSGKFDGFTRESLARIAAEAEKRVGHSLSLHVAGYSRGGDLVGRTMRGVKTPEEMKKYVVQVPEMSLMDTNCLNYENVVRYIEAGGKVNIGFIQGSIGDRGAVKIMKRFGLTEVTPGVYQSADGKVRVERGRGEGRGAHGTVPDQFLAKFMRESLKHVGVEVPATMVGGPPSGERPPNAPPSAPPGGEISDIESSPKLSPGIDVNDPVFKQYIDMLNARLQTPEKIAEFQKWAESQTDIEKLRRGGITAMENAQNPFEKHLRLSSLYLKQDAARFGSFSVDFKKLHTAEKRIGAGHLLPPTIKAIRVFDEHGTLLFDRAERRVVNGRVGYFVSGTDQYAFIHTGYRIDVLETQDVKHEETQKRIAEENSLFEKEERKIYLKDALRNYLTSSGIGEDVLVNDDYFTGQLDKTFDDLNKTYPEWWNDLSAGKLDTAKFNQFLSAVIKPEDLVMLKNLSKLWKKNFGQPLYMSVFLTVKDDPSFAVLKGRELSESELSVYEKDLLREAPTAMDMMISQKLFEITGKMYQRGAGEFIRGHCEQASDVYTRAMLSQLGEKGYGLNFNAPVAEKATRFLRGKRVSSLTYADLRSVRPGMVFFVNGTRGYGDKLQPGTTNRLPRIPGSDKDGRHWFTYLGSSKNGEPVFADNWGARQSLETVQNMVGNRSVINIHDPYADVRKKAGALV